VFWFAGDWGGVGGIYRGGGLIFLIGRIGGRGALRFLAGLRETLVRRTQIAPSPESRCAAPPGCARPPHGRAHSHRLGFLRRRAKAVG